MSTDHPNDWDIRGELAATLTCWHRLSSTEAAELVQYATEFHLQIRKKSDAIQRLWAERDALQSKLTALESQAPAAWGHRGKNGVIRDCIGPDSHADREGDYTIPLFLTGAKPTSEALEGTP